MIQSQIFFKYLHYSSGGVLGIYCNYFMFNEYQRTKMLSTQKQ